MTSKDLERSGRRTADERRTANGGRRRVGRLALFGLLTGFALFLVTPTGCYLSRAGWEEARILAGRRTIAELAADPAVDDGTRAKLRLVLDVRRWAVDSLRLDAKESFTRYTQLRRDTLVLVLSAARRDTLAPYTWWFPIVGRVPYKGYFDFDAARDAARTLEQAGYDTYLRPSSAFSTLGFFNDPLLSTTLREDRLDLANTVVHELTHNGFYAAGQAVFNESYANFVGARGAAEYFRFRGDTVAARMVEGRWDDEKRLARYWTRVAASLDSAYAANAGRDSAAKVATRDTVYAQARVRLRQLMDSLPTVNRRYADRVLLNNAALLARRIYLSDLDLFDAVWEAQGRDLRAAMRAIERAAKGAKDPFAAVRALVPPAAATPRTAPAASP